MKIQDSLYIRLTAALGIAGVQIMTWSTNLIGFDRTMALGDVVGDMLYGLFRRPRLRIHHNLKFAFGDSLSEAERNGIAKTVLRFFAKNWLELFFYAGAKKQAVRDRITVVGLEHLDRALAKGKGVIAVSAHIGNYGLLGTQFTERGYDFTVVIREPKNPGIAKTYENGRAKMGLRTISTNPERRFFTGVLKVLARNGILCLISDENKRKGGVFVDFFGRTASTPPGPAALALRTGAAIVPVFINRNPDNSHRIIIEEEISWEKSGDPERDVFAITTRFTAVIEQRIRADLSQWMWSNFRWRTQLAGPDDDAKLKKFQPVKRLKKKIRKALAR